FHIGGLVSPPSPAAVESVLSTLATRSVTFQSLQPLHQLVPANARRRVTAYLLSHPQFLDAGLVKRIMEEWHGGTCPANSQGVTIPTSVGDLRITLASRVVRQFDTAAPASTSDAMLETAAEGNLDPAPRTGEAPSHNTADLPAPLVPSSELTMSSSGLAAATSVRDIPANAESTSGPCPLSSPFEAEGMPSLAPSTEEVSSVLPVPAPSPLPPASSEVSVPSSTVAPSPDLAADDVGPAPPCPSESRASPLPAVSAGIAPMTPPMDCELTPQLRGAEYAAGVVIAVHRSVASNWSDISRDERGRGISACLLLANGGRLRVVGLYGPTGGNLPNFAHSPDNLAAETSLKAFISQEERKAAMAGDAMIVGGDLNSVVSQPLDTWEGSHIDRIDCVARHLAAMGLMDVFRAFHQDIRAFTFFSTVSASRLDSIWYLPAPAWAASPVNSSILWQWSHRTDHEPVMVDFTFQLPVIHTTLPRPSPTWKTITGLLGSPDMARTCQQVHRKLEQHKLRLQLISERFTEAEMLLDATSKPPCEGVVGLWDELIPPAADEAKRLRDIVDGSFSELQAILLSCLPDVAAGASRRNAKASEAWHHCLLELKSIRRYLQDIAANPLKQFVMEKISLQQASTLAAKATALMRLVQTNFHHVEASVTWDSFRSNLVEWVGTLGVPEFRQLQCEAALSSASLTRFSRSTVGNLASSMLPFRWSLNIGVTDRRHAPTLIAQVTEWIDNVHKLYSSCTNKQSRGYLQDRRQRLRAGDVKGWAKLMRPLPQPRLEYLPDWCVRDDGVAYRPTTVSDVLRGAEQEWGALLREPAESWSHDLIRSYQDSTGRIRGMLDFISVMSSHGNENLHRVSDALLYPGPWLLLSWHRHQLHIWTEHCLVVAGWVLRWDGWAWVGYRQAPCCGARCKSFSGEALTFKDELVLLAVDYEKFFNTLQLAEIVSHSPGRHLAYFCLPGSYERTALKATERVGDLPGISETLTLGSASSGVGFSWKKCRAFASDWDERQEQAGPQVQLQGLQLRSWDIWSGGFKQVVIPRALPDEEEVLLGKRGTLRDKHTLASEDVLKSIRSAKLRIASKRCSWDEASALMQWVVGGILSYAPLLGIPSPEEVHAEDQAFQRLLLHTVGTRSTAERASLLAPRSSGGLGAPCLVELLISSAASDVLLLLNGSSQVALIARDTLRQAIESHPDQLDSHEGTLLSALKFLAGYGLYVEVSTDRMVGRILDCIAGENALSQPFTVAFQPATHARALVYCRVGLAANSIRRAWHRIRTVAPVQEWFSVACWTEHLDLACPFPPSTCANAARRASEQAESDWRTECAIFRPGNASPPISEDWPVEAWERANSVPDARTAFLMAQASCLQLEGWDYAMFGDGGRVCQNCPTYSYQARSFGPVGDYWGTSSVVSDRHVGCLPLRVGWEHTGVHEAELAAMLGSLRYRRHGEWMLLVADRSALFHILNKASVGDEAVLLRQHCQPWVTRLWHILRERAASWKPGVPIPSWRLQQIELPSAWNMQLPGDADSRNKWYSRIAFSRFGLVGVDIKSHQTHTALPHPVLAQGNQQQDEGCAVARTLPRPSDIRKPAGGPFVYLVCQGHSVTSPVRDFLRKAMRKEALTKWASKPVQGLIAHVGQELFKPCLNPELYRHCHIPAPWKRWALAQDDKYVDLAPMFFRCTRSIGGSWTERLHSDADLQTLAQRWILYRGLDSVRTCPLCGRGPCTPRHVFMSCEHMRPLVDALRDSVETALTASQPSDSLIAAAAGWRSRSANLLPGVPSPEDAARWPVLSAWRWMVAIPEREAFLTEEPRGSSRDSSRRAKGHDLAYRGVIPLALGKALCSLHHSEDADHLLPPDTFATLRQPGLAADEVAASRSRASRIQPALMVNSLLTLLDNMHPAGDPQMVPFMPGAIIAAVRASMRCQRLLVAVGNVGVLSFFPALPDPAGGATMKVGTSHVVVAVAGCTNGGSVVLGIVGPASTIYQGLMNHMRCAQIACGFGCKRGWPAQDGKAFLTMVDGTTCIALHEYEWD
ncbi:unnamed protein product, partial [Symbiodinium necroappetens]